MTDLKQDLQSIADRHAEQAAGDFDSVLRTATSRGRRRIAAVLAAACAVLVVGGIATLASWQDDSLPAPAPVATGPTLDPKYRGTMTITPATARPGAQIGLTYPEGYERGLQFALFDADSGKQLYYLATGWAGTKPRWRPVGGDTLGGPDVGIKGPGPDILVVPTTASGTYLLCTDNTSKRACALLTVAR
jgi:hypothetical protein